MRPCGLFAIFSYVTFSNAWKPLLNMFSFQENQTKRGRWLCGCLWVERSNLRARFQAINQLSFILFACYYILTTRIWFSWQAELVVKHMTWVRAPGLHVFNIIFPLTFICSVWTEDHHASSKSSRPRVPEHQIKGIDWRNTLNPSQRCHMVSGKVSGPEGYWAQISWAIPPLWGLPPP